MRGNRVATIRRLLGMSLLLISLACLVYPSPALAATTPVQVVYFVLPHPDDEWQTWSLVENSPDNYQVFILLTKGEQTSYCNPEKNEPSKWSAACAEKRMQSWVDFFRQMGKSDESIPSDLEYLGSKGPFPATIAGKTYTLRRTDGTTTRQASRSAEVWRDRKGRGALISFDLGDGDLTNDEVFWGVKTVLSQRATLGINATLPDYTMVGAYSNLQYSGCAIYNHKDHRAIHEVLFNTQNSQFSSNIGHRNAATCYTDPDLVRDKTVSQTAKSAAWGRGGAFAKYYGWLGGYVLDKGDGPFYSRQYFWQRHN